MSNRTLSTPEELRDFAIGKQIYKAGGYLNDCTSEAMRRGFSRMASQYLYMDWKIFNDAATDEQPQQAVMFSASALEAASKRSIYDTGTVQENPFF